ncbi:hypothetical protein TNCV_4022451 [Trichonephila clavipes]|nr:hypothetical protein TNCV_4022451 [Trichonephila clavipes]
MLGRRIAARPRPPATVRDLEIALLEEWNSIPQSLIYNLIASMANSALAALGTLNSRRAASPLVRLVEGEKRWEDPDTSWVFSLKIGVEPSKIVLPPARCSMLSIEQKGCVAFHSKRESISGESPTTIPEDTSMPYSGFEPEPARLQAECPNHHTR